MDQFVKLFELNSNYSSQNSDHLYHGFELESYIVKEHKQNNQFTGFTLNNEASYIFKTNFRKDEYEIQTEAHASQIELTPTKPFKSFLFGEPMLNSLKFCYENISENLNSGDHMYLCSTFQSFGSKVDMKYLGLEGKSTEEIIRENKISGSRFISDGVICPKLKYLKIMHNYVTRAGNCGPTQLPLYEDEMTNMDHSDDYDTLPGHLSLDRFLGSISMSSIQITFASTNLDQARWQYDQLFIFGSWIVRFLNFN